MRCCNIIILLNHIGDGHFSMGSTVFLLKIGFSLMNKTIKIWVKSLQLPYANKAKF